MARHVRDGALETRANRLKLPIAKKPIFAKIGQGVAIGYRRNATAGTWVVRAADGKGGNWTRRIADADDHEGANGSTVLDFWAAQDRAREMARAGKAGENASEAPLDVTAALDGYEADLRIRNADPANAQRARGHLTDALARRPVALLTATELERWRNGLADHMAPASVNRVATTLRAALERVARLSRGGIANADAWKIGLAALPDAHVARNVVLTDADVRRVIREAYRESPQFGLLVEVAAVTGARVSQIARLECRDIGSDFVALPTARKGKGVKAVHRRQTPMPASTLTKLRGAAKGREDGERLLLKPSGEPWAKSDHSRIFERVAKRAKLDPNEVTLYALRHSNIVRHLNAGTPIRQLAVLHDTSVAMIERSYSANLDKHLDAVVRPALFKVRGK